ncbi:MAG TPA: bifunctional (p)ppGpp synthetase/guanosine-3',5'-bis(diphosphate) 3'-pyrophosphohydrolase [Caldimonas sp.]|nr:bifunctional (p)ppGpp synthetase/guanosine-3',5'-bis(diphosphate) 3'-pyrophosphohydrolase [Caldimonas sp.]
MKTHTEGPVEAADIVRLLGDDAAAPDDGARGAPSHDLVREEQVLDRARAFAAPLLEGTALDTGEDVLAHADAVAAILRGIGAAPSLCAASYLVYAADHLGKPEEAIGKAFGPSLARLVTHARKLLALQRAAQGARVEASRRAEQLERVRKMLLAFSHDLRVVLLRLASRLQTLRWYAASKEPIPRELAAESLQVFAPLANRLGIWQIKWELEDLSFRFLEPEHYRTVARLLDEKRAEREQRVERLRRRLGDDLAARGIRAQVQGRPKHLYSIWKKMQDKRLGFDRVLDVRALRVIVPDVPSCYAVLGRVHELFRAVPGELDDYIARPKANGYQSLHTVVEDDDGKPVEIQVRTQSMHEHAEHGISAHWAYKEAGARGAAGVAASGGFEQRIAEARLVVLRQLLAWERDAAAAKDDDRGGATEGAGTAPLFDDRIYVFTPQAAIVELTAGATPVDFAYAVHTDLGHRCRGAKVDGAMVPLNKRLASGQMVEIVAAKSGGPSLDWLNPDLGYVQSPRARAKVRAWFNAQAQSATVARGREAVEKLLQREGRTAIKLDDLAARLGFKTADALFDVVGKDEFSLRSIENLLRPAEPLPTPDEQVVLKRSRPVAEGKGGVLVVGVESLLTVLAKCCRPAPPDDVRGFVTRGKGVAVHRATCATFRQMAARAPERVIPVAWGARDAAAGAHYPVDVQVEALDRHGLLRDISEVFAKEKMNVIAATTQSSRASGRAIARMTFTVEVADTARLGEVLALVERVSGVTAVRRR